MSHKNLNANQNQELSPCQPDTGDSLSKQMSKESSLLLDLINQYETQYSRTDLSRRPSNKKKIEITPIQTQQQQVIDNQPHEVTEEAVEETKDEVFIREKSFRDL